MKTSEAYKKWCPFIQDWCVTSPCMMWVEIGKDNEGDCVIRIKVRT